MGIATKARIRLENTRRVFGESTMTIRSRRFKSIRVKYVGPGRDYLHYKPSILAHTAAPALHSSFLAFF